MPLKDGRETTIVAAAAALVVAGAVAFVASPRLGMVALAAPAALLVVVSPAAGAMLLLFALPLEELAALTPGGVVTIHKLLGMAVVGAWLLRSLVRRVPIQAPAIAAVPAAFVVWAATSALWSRDPGLSIHLTVTLAQVFGLYLLVLNVLDTPATLRRALYAHVAGAVVLSVFGLYLTGTGILQAGRTAIVVDQQLLMEPNGFAAALLLPVAICMGSGLDRTRPGWERLALVAGGMLCVTTVLLTMSRGALVALVLMAAVASVARGQILLLVLGAVLAVPGLLLASPEFWERLSQGATLADRGAGRLDIWQVGWEIIRTHPLFGVGLGSFPLVYYDFLSQATGVSWKHAMAVAHTLQRAPHNIYLGVTAELGLVGIGLLTAMLALHLRAAFAAWRRLARAGHPAAGLLLTATMGLVALVVQGFAFDIEHRKYLWLALGLAAIGARRVTIAVETGALPLRRAA